MRTFVYSRPEQSCLGAGGFDAAVFIYSAGSIRCGMNDSGYVNVRSRRVDKNIFGDIYLYVVT